MNNEFEHLNDEEIGTQEQQNTEESVQPAVRREPLGSDAPPDASAASPQARAAVVSTSG